MGPISLILAVILVGSGSLGLAQEDPFTTDLQESIPPSNPSTAPASLISPWSQWMSLKAPPISLAMPKKKKLLPGPAPPAGTPEAPFVTWTRMKLNTALSPPPAPPSSPVGASPVETPWDAWMKVRTSMAAPAAVATGNAGPSRRMAPDRYSIASTVPPHPLWSSQKPPTSSTSSNPGASLASQQVRVVPVLPNSPPMAAPSRSTYLDLVNSLATPNVSARLPYGSAPPLVGQSVATKPSLAAAAIAASSMSRPLQIRPSKVTSSLPQSAPQEVPSAVPAASNSDLSTVLRPIPHQIIEEIQAKGTPEEIASIIKAVSNAESVPTPSPSGPALPSEEITVESLLPETLISKLTPELRPLLSTPLEINPATGLLAKEPMGAVSVPLAILPESIRQPILEKATPEELNLLLDTLSKIEAVPPSKQGPIAQLDVESVLPPTLVSKFAPEMKPLLESKLAPPVLQATLPKPILEAVLKAEPSPNEVSLLLANLVEVEKLSPELKGPLPPLGVLLPPTLVPKLSPKVYSLLNEPLPPRTTPPPKEILVSNALSALPPQVLNDIMTKASPSELSNLIGSLSSLEAKVPSESPTVVQVLPPTLIPKLSPQIKPLLGQSLVLPQVSILSVIPEPVLKVVLQVATLEDLAEIAKTIEKVQEAQIPEKKPVSALLPPDLLAKIPAPVIPLISRPIAVPAKPVAPTKPTAMPPKPNTVAALISVLSSAPPPVLPAIFQVATPAEIKELTDTIAKLENLPPSQKSLVSQVTLETIIPPTLLAKLPVSVNPMLRTSVILPTSSASGAPKIPTLTPPSKPSPVVLPPPPVQVATVPTGKLPLPLETVFSAAPPNVLPALMKVSTPAELAILTETIEKLENLSPAEKPLASQVSLEAIIPSTLFAKLPPSVLPLLQEPVVLSPTPNIVAPSTPALPADSGVESDALLTVLAAAPPPVLPMILSLATETELSELSKTIENLEALPPPEKALVPQVSLSAILPPTLLEKIPPSTFPLLQVPVVLPPSQEVASSPPDSVLQLIPEPIHNAILSVATPSELNQLTEVLTNVESITPVPQLPLVLLLPPTLVPKLPSTVLPLLNEPLELPAPSTEATPSTPVAATPEEKLLVKWAKKILLKTGKPTTPIPGEVSPLQAAWMDWVQMKINETTPKVTPISSSAAPEVTTQYPWTKWLKLKSNSTSESITAATAMSSPEVGVSDWLASLEPTTPPPSSQSDNISKILKELGIENVDLPPEQISALLESLQTDKPILPTPSPIAPPMLSPNVQLSPPPTIPYLPYIPPKPIIRPYPFAYYPPWFAPPPSPEYFPPSPTTSQPPPLSTSSEPVPSPSLNLTEYLIKHKLISPETPPTTSIPISTLAKLLEDEVESPSSPEAPSSDVVLAPEVSTERSLMASELASLTPTKFAALLKQILKDCNRTVSHLSTRSSHSSKKKKGKKDGPISPIGAYYKNKYAKLKGPYASKFARALYPIPSQGVAQPPAPPSDTLPLPKLNTTGTIVDPAYWAAQKSLFLSKLFATLAKVAMNDTQNIPATSPSPKALLSKQIDKVLLGDMTRSIKDSSSEEDDSSQEDSQEDDEVNEKKLVLEDGSEPSNVPKEPSNPLHKLFKFGVQKSVLSDLSSTTPKPPTPAKSGPTSEEKEMIDRLKKTLAQTKMKTSTPTKKKKKKHHHHHHHHGHSKKHSFRPTPPPTTENPVDFEMLAKALLLDDNVGDPPKSQGQGGGGN